MDSAQMLPAIASADGHVFSENRYVDDQPPKRHCGPIFGMMGTQTFGVGDSFDWSAIASAIPAACGGVSERIIDRLKLLTEKILCSLLQGNLQSQISDHRHHRNHSSFQKITWMSVIL
jgi:hypothetical protein